MLRTRVINSSTKIYDSEKILLSDCLAKTWKKEDGIIYAGQDVHTHCLIVASVAKALLGRLPDWLTSKYFPDGSALIAGCHDIGKISPTFQHKIFDNLSHKSINIPLSVQNAYLDEMQWGGHAGVSMATAKLLQVGKFIPDILGQHHGFKPPLGSRPGDCEVFGGQNWLALRIQLVENLKTQLKEKFPVVNSATQAKLLAGLTTVSDWIGSGRLFEDPAKEWQNKIEQALDSAGFLAPQYKPELTFEQIFGVHPHYFQRKILEMPHKPGVYIIEAPMGIGKTEAALYLAYKLIIQNKATGMYFALPTQLTSEKIHERVKEFLKKILTEESQHHTPLLLHANAWMKWAEMGEDMAPGSAWFSQGKKGILAPFAVGTIDQALMSVLNVKHGFVRTFGLAGKVVILDEVHTYDTFTGTLMNELVEELREIGCTVIILSATLTKDNREKILKTPVKSDFYPLITRVDSCNKEVMEISVDVYNSKTVNVEVEPNDARCYDYVLELAEQGQQILWIENVVADAQLVYQKLGARACEMGIKTGLLHSRFTQMHRQENERDWVTIYGKDGQSKRSEMGRILVGTQVLEQSLDIDADLLVTRIAPTDMLLQRMGRLWRHENPNRNKHAQIKTIVLSPEINQVINQPEKCLGGSAKVYSPYVICRTLEVWQNRNQISLPDDIRDLIESTYCKRQESGKLEKYLANLEKHCGILRNFALVGLSTNMSTKPDEQVNTRYSDQETVDVLLLNKIVLGQKFKNKSGALLTLLDNKQIFLPYNGKAFGHAVWREKAATLALHVVKIAVHQAPGPIIMKQLNWLKDYCYLGQQGSNDSLLRVGLVGKEGQIMSLDGFSSTNDKYNLSYNNFLGYKAEKIIKETIW